MTDEEAEQSMRIPDGKTCGDCVHVRRCLAFGFTDDRLNVWCDFFPNKFRLPILHATSAKALAAFRKDPSNA